MKIILDCKWDGEAKTWKALSRQPYAGATIEVEGDNPADLHARVLVVCNKLRPDIGIDPLEIELNFEGEAP